MFMYIKRSYRNSHFYKLQYYQHKIQESRYGKHFSIFVYFK